MSKLSGISIRDCAKGCNEQACVIGGRPRCMHPCKSGIPIELLNDRTVQEAFDHACSTLGVRNIYKPAQGAS
ncbi:hypothetical protein [Bradyrhizobium sp. 150]|uniref:hypothetical protein n=1 Tax=Bradyrhizobium sp. 150 TaxID=2782625 RepID=UPI001FFBD5CA|nr:hypothetical protein [Bradyrhizobium sp. 150]MCK1672797.1 hypothetical protein [Bradyrhizobium sp. 150]